jgi:MFS family permease
MVWLTYELTQSPILLGLLGLVRAIPVITISPIAGVVADRVDQRRLLLWLQLFACLNSLAMGLLIVTNRLEIWQIFLQAALQATIASFDASTRQAMYPRLVPRSVLVEAITLHSIAGRSGQLFGPALGGLAIAHFGVATPFFLNAATFFVLIVAVWLIRPLQELTRASSTWRTDLRQGMRSILSSEILRAVVSLELAYGFFQMNPVMITIIARDLLGAGPEELGTLLAAPAVGALVGVVLLVALRQTSRKGAFVILSTLAYAVVLVGIAFSSTYATTFLLLGALGLLDALVTVTRLSITQLVAPETMRGRVVANMRTVSAGVNQLAQVQSGLLVAWLGPATAVIGSASIITGGIGLVIRRHAAFWRFRDR